MPQNSSEHKETIVIGAGPAGYVAAIRASELGHSVTIVEKTYIGGTCLNIGCIPSKALITAAHRYHNAKHSDVFGISAGEATIDMEATQKWKDEKVVRALTGGVKMLLSKHKVKIIKGTASFKDEKTVQIETADGTSDHTFDHVILATGTTAKSLDEVPFGGRVIDTTGALNVKEVPESITIVGGGGFVGSQLAGAFSNLGVNVTILEKEDRILHFFDKDMSDLVAKNYTGKGINIVTGVNIKSSEQTDNDVTITYEKDGKEETITSSVALVSVGRNPHTESLKLENAGVKLNADGQVDVDNKMRTNVKGIYAIGDIKPGSMLADEAMYDGKTVADVITEDEESIAPHEDHDVTHSIPMAVYTEPELATVGMSAAEAKKAGKRYKQSKFPIAANGRALSLNQPEGFVRLITDEEQDGKLVGAQFAGVSASDISGSLNLAIETGMNAEDIALTIQGHPSIGETITDAAELAMGNPIHI